MSPLNSRLVRLTRAVCLPLVLCLFAVPRVVQAQDRIQEVTDGHGGIAGAPVRPVQSLDLHPGQVQTISLHPRFHTVIEFPYLVAQIDTGDPDVFLADITGNKVTLKATKVTRSETSMSVILADANMTVVPFHVRADSTQPIVYVLRYTDPVSKHLNAAEAQIASQIRADESLRVAHLSEQRLRQRMLLASDVVRINKQGSDGRAGERLSISVETAQEVPNEQGASELYLRYRLHNQSVAPLTDLQFVVRVVQKSRKMFFFTRTKEREIFDVRDVRSTAEIPAGAATAGLLITDSIDLQDNESLSIEAIGFNGQRRVRIDRILVGG